MPLDGQCVTDPQHDAREAHGEVVGVDPEHVRERHAGQRVRDRTADGGVQRGDAIPQVGLEPAKGVVRDVEEVAASAGRIEDPERRELVQERDGLVGVVERVDPQATGRHDRRLDDLVDLALRGVVGTDLVTTLRVDARLQQATEDGRLDLRPVGGRGGQEEVDLRGLQIDPCRPVEQTAVGVGDRLEHAGPPAVLVAQDREELADGVQVAERRVAMEPPQQRREGPVVEQAQVLGEHAPRHLEHEVACRRLRDPASEQQVMDLRDGVDGLAGEVDLPHGEVRLAVPQDVEDLRPLDEVAQADVGTHDAGVVAGLEHQEPPERAEDDEPGAALLAGPGGAPVGLGLRVVLLEAIGLRGRLHLDQHLLRQQQVGVLLIALDLERHLEEHVVVLRRTAVTGEELAEELLRLLLLAALPCLPALPEPLEPPLERRAVDGGLRGRVRRLHAHAAHRRGR